MKSIDLAAFGYALYTGVSTADRHATAELTKYFRTATGRVLKRRRGHVADADPGMHAIVLSGGTTVPAGVGERLASELPETADAFLIRHLDSGDLVLAGRSVRALHYAVYTFLNRLGCHWPGCGPHWEVTPNRPVLTVPDPSVTESPRFPVRGIDPVDRIAEYTPRAVREHLDWCVRNRWNRFLVMMRTDQPHMRKTLLPIIAREAALRGLDVLIPLHFINVVPRDLLPEYPEYFALHQGPPTGHAAELPHRQTAAGWRVSIQMCPSSPELRRTYAQRLVALIDSFPDTVRDFSIVPGDGSGFCSCPACRDLSPADQVQLIWNTAYDSLAIHRPDVRLHRVAYTSWQEPPDRVSFDPNRVATLVYDLFMRSDEIPLREEFGAAACWRPGQPHFTNVHAGLVHYLKQWRDRGVAVVPWHNSMKMFRRGTGAGFVSVFEADFRFYEELGAAGSDFEAYIQYWPGFAANFYGASLMLWDRSATADGALTEFCDLAFGPAADPMRTVYDRLEEVTRNQTNGYWVCDRFTAPDVNRLRQLFRDAQSRTDDAGTRHRIRDVEAIFEYMFAWRAERIAESAAQDALGAGDLKTAALSLRRAIRGNARTARRTERIVKHTGYYDWHFSSLHEERVKEYRRQLQEIERARAFPPAPLGP